MNNLAFAYYSAGRIKDALPLYESAVEIRREIFPDHPDTRRLMNDPAYAYYSLGRREDAISLYETALAAQRGNPGVHHPDTLRTMHNLAKAYDSAGRIQDAIQLWLECGAYFEALLSARHAENELMSSLVESSVAQDVDEVRLPRDRAVVGELRLVGGHPESAEAAIRAGIDGLDNAPASMYKSLGVVLIAQGKSDEATKAFRTALARTRQDDGTFKLEGADIVEMTAAYFLDLISQDEYVASMAESKADACVPWFYVGQRMEFGGDREAALAAYKRSVELGDEETADATRRLARWRLTELQKRVE
jgi:tetratricopeptide (TPR) repeat protein